MAASNAYSDFMKKFAAKNAVSKTMAYNVEGTWGKVFGVGIVAGIMKADGALGKLRAGLTGLLSLALPFNRVLGLGLFKGMKTGIQAVLRDTGSLEAALNRLTQIQGLQRVFAPLVGGIDAAKRKVAELVSFQSKSPFTLGDVGAGAKTLQTGTRGAFSGTKDLATVGDAAAASGNTFADASEAVTSFYESLARRRRNRWRG